MYIPNIFKNFPKFFLLVTHYLLSPRTNSWPVTPWLVMTSHCAVRCQLADQSSYVTFGRHLTIRCDSCHATGDWSVTWSWQVTMWLVSYLPVVETIGQGRRTHATALWPQNTCNYDSQLHLHPISTSPILLWILIRFCWRFPQRQPWSRSTSRHYGPVV